MNHIADANKMVSDTPRTDEQINGKPCTRFECLAGDSLRDALVPSQFARQLERELNAANERIKRMEEAGDELLMWLGEDISESNGQLLQDAWNKAKEVKP